MTALTRIQTFTLSNRAMLDRAKVDVLAARNPALMQAISEIALAAGVDVLCIGGYGVSGRLPLSRFVELFGFEPEASRGYSRKANLPGDENNLADVVQVAPPVEYL